MATIIRVDPKAGTVEAVYDDRFAGFMTEWARQMGSKQDIQRATDVEFDAVSGEWTAHYRGTGELIAHGSNRALVIEQEVAWLENKLRHGQSCHVDAG